MHLVILKNFTLYNVKIFYELSNRFLYFKDYLPKLLYGSFKGTPFTLIGKKYMGGYSDHFPVYAIFKK
jgi:hypothetical protein